MEGSGVMGDEKPHSNPRPSHSLLGRLLVPKCNGPGQHCALRARVSFCKAGIQGTCTVAAAICSRKAAISSTRVSNLGVMVNWGW